MRRLFRISVPQEFDGERLDRVVPALTDEISRTALRKIVDLGGVHVEGRRVRTCSKVVLPGWKIEIHLDGLPLTPFRLRDEHIIYRDRYLLVIDKPPGVDTQPTHARYKGTLYEALKVFLQDPSRPHARPSLGMVQRLDRDTSGAMVFSTHPRAHKGLTRCFAERLTEKLYLALVEGAPEQDVGEIRSMLARERKSNRVKTVPAGGKDAVTRFRVRERFSSACLLEVEIPTGRSHQIRAHMAESGHPLVGDALYGGPQRLAGEAVGRQMLHAARLAFPHPVTGEYLAFEAPLCPDMSRALEACRNDLQGPEPSAKDPS
ncbi:MAG: RluA family pseudouridine synthase [Desulfuromonadales bacterium]|nr:RluA family pseudouridine synthase [Desulfuromonadales bacterium]